MAKFTDVPNSGLTSGAIPKNLKNWYVEKVEEFAKKYAGQTTITFAANAAKWEGHVTNENFRLDFQGAANGYGNIQAQWGKGQTNGGSYGGVLLACGVTFSIADVQKGLRQSLDSNGKNLVKLDVDEEQVDIVPPSGKPRSAKPMKTKPGKAAWTPDTVYE